MADASVEKTLKSLQEEIKSLKHGLERAAAVNEIQNLMSTYEYLHTANRHQDVCKLFAKKAPGVRVYFGEVGYWEGPDAPQRAWSILERMGDTTGMMALHPISTSVIEVAADGKTAKGVWIGTGVVANVRGGKPSCNWEWDKYGIDFIKEDGEWKIWHHHIYRLLHGLNWDDKWADQFNRPEHVFKVPDDIPISGPATEDNPYTPKTKQLLIPVPPKPYKTWKDTTMY
jgi:hypothetical protein